MAIFAQADPQDIAASTQPIGAGKVVGLDYFYNHQMRDGKQVGPIWENEGDDGYSKFGELWHHEGATLTGLDHAPSRQDLDRLSIYIIVSPCNQETAPDHHPSYIETDAIDAIVSWVKNGGVLLMFGNSKGHCELDHLNNLGGEFGIRFKNDQSSTEPKPGDTSISYRGEEVLTYPEQIEFSGDPIGRAGFPDHVLFKGVKAIRIDEFDTLALSDPAEKLLSEEHSWAFRRPIRPPQGFTRGGIHSEWTFEDTIIGIRCLGKGLVFAVGSPWFYNGNLHNPLTADPDNNHRVAENLAYWLLTVSREPQVGN